MYLYGIEIALRLLRAAARPVLIVPLWNWNGVEFKVSLKNKIVLIVPLWNWNTASTCSQVSASGSNCTFMELKWVIISKTSRGVVVLIVPLWNWNCSPASASRCTSCSNCTFMELKWSGRTRSRCRHLVLIVPLWNWNMEVWDYYDMLSSVLIVPLWNWNNLGRPFRVHPYIVLIVPLWNWNWSVDPHTSKKMLRSNCTFMELKWNSCFSSGVWSIVLIVPLWNWNEGAFS